MVVGGPEMTPEGVSTLAQPPLFLVGCSRSGTTLLRLVLDSSPDIAIPYESHFIPPVWKKRARYETDAGLDLVALCQDVLTSRWFKGWQIPAKLVTEHLATLQAPTLTRALEAIFLTYAAYHGKVRWGDKTPGYVRHIPMLAEIFPEARFIHIIRDGRDVALSMMDAGARWGGPRTIPAIAAYWATRVREGRTGGRALAPMRYMEVHYESLVQEPELTLRGICAFADLHYEGEMLEFSDRAFHAIPSDRMSFHANLVKPITQGLRDWRSQMSPRQVALFEAVAGPDLEAMGYLRACRTRPLSVRIEAFGALKAGAVVRRSRRLFLHSRSKP